MYCSFCLQNSTANENQTMLWYKKEIILKVEYSKVFVRQINTCGSIKHGAKCSVTRKQVHNLDWYFFFSSEDHGLPSLRSQLCTGKRVEWKKRIIGVSVSHGVYCLCI